MSEGDTSIVYEVCPNCSAERHVDAPLLNDEQRANAVPFTTLCAECRTAAEEEAA